MTPTTETRASFFRQGGWMVVATVAGGVFMTLVHSLVTSKSSMQSSEYSVFCSLLKVYLLLGIPAGGLQTVFAQQTAAAHSEEDHRQLTQTTRSVLKITLLVWLACGTIVLSLSGSICESLKISEPFALLFTLFLGLATLWMPIFKGLLQGVQNFGGLGCVFIFDGLLRFSAVAVLVVIFKYQAAGGMAAALTGNIVALGIGAWLTRKIWRGPSSPFYWKTWLSKVGPLTIGSGCVLIMSIADTVFIQSVFPNTFNYLYMAGSMIGFALIQFTAPLAIVMFPKIARSVARSQQSNALKMTLEGTLLLGGLAALGCTFLPELPLRIIYFRNPDGYIPAAPLVPWFCWCMLFISLANALVSNLLAQEKFGFVVILALITAAYGCDLYYLRNTLVSMGTFTAFKTVIQILSIYNITLFGAAIWYSWRIAPKSILLERTGGN